jgi:hypothetical protein
MINKIRWWIVKKLSGDRPVLINVSFTSLGPVRSTGKTGLVYKSYIEEVEVNDSVKSDNA